MLILEVPGKILIELISTGIEIGFFFRKKKRYIFVVVILLIALAVYAIEYLADDTAGLSFEWMIFLVRKLRKSGFITLLYTSDATLTILYSITGIIVGSCSFIIARGIYLVNRQNAETSKVSSNQPGSYRWYHCWYYDHYKTSSNLRSSTSPRRFLAMIFPSGPIRKLYGI